MLNVITLVGRLTRDPELRKTNSGTSVSAFTLAVDNGKAANGDKATLFMDCNAFGNQADTVCKFVRKGHLLGVNGRLVSRKYTNKEGVNVTAFSVEVNRVELMEPKANTNSEGEGTETAQQPTTPINESHDLGKVEVTDDELPF